MKLLSGLALLIFFSVHTAFADEASIKAGMEMKFPYEKVLSVHKTPYFGLYEVVFNDQLVYTDENMTYIFSGNIIDLHTMQNLTEARERQLYAIDFNSLPLDLAIKNVKGNGKRKLAVFSDPNCPYCRKQEKELVNLKDATIYIFMLPILAGSEEKAKAIWCASDRLKAWEDNMLNKVDPRPGKKCDTTALTRIAAVAQKLDIVVTPTLVFEDGVIKPGWLTLDTLDERLTSSIRK